MFLPLSGRLLGSVARCRDRRVSVYPSWRALTGIGKGRGQEAGGLRQVKDELVAINRQIKGLEERIGGVAKQMQELRGDIQTLGQGVQNAIGFGKNRTEDLEEEIVDSVANRLEHITTIRPRLLSIRELHSPGGFKRKLVEWDGILAHGRQLICIESKMTIDQSHIDEMPDRLQTTQSFMEAVRRWKAEGSSGSGYTREFLMEADTMVGAFGELLDVVEVKGIIGPIRPSTRALAAEASSRGLGFIVRDFTSLDQLCLPNEGWAA